MPSYFHLTTASNRWMHLCQIFGLSGRSERQKRHRLFHLMYSTFSPTFPSFFPPLHVDSSGGWGKGQNYCLTVVGRQGARVWTVREGSGSSMTEMEGVRRLWYHLKFICTSPMEWNLLKDIRFASNIASECLLEFLDLFHSLDKLFTGFTSNLRGEIIRFINF